MNHSMLPRPSPLQTLDRSQHAGMKQAAMRALATRVSQHQRLVGESTLRALRLPCARKLDLVASCLQSR